MPSRKKKSAPAPSLQKVTTNLLPSDVEKLRELANEKAIPYQVLLRSLLHDALRQL